MRTLLFLMLASSCTPRHVCEDSADCSAGICVAGDDGGTRCVVAHAPPKTRATSTSTSPVVARGGAFALRGTLTPVGGTR